jgi:alginate O-acetyltransferase complex protein AlgJ
MALFSRLRRPLALAVLAALALPVLLMPVRPVETVSVREKRVLAPAPAWPRDLAAARHMPREIDAYLADHFAFRDVMVRAGNALQRELGVTAAPRLAVEGRDGWLFYSDGLLQSSGQVHEAAQTSDFAAFICDLNARLVARGVRTGFALVPSPGEIYPEALPPWAGPARRPTDYDHVIARVRACGVAAVDLRPALIAAKRQGLIYRRTDSHWTLLGAAFGYNAMLEAVGRPDWRVAIDPRAWRERTFRNGDLPALAGLEPRDERAPVERRFEGPPLPRVTIQGVEFANHPPFVIDGKGPGPTLLVIGDSFTEDPMPPFFIDHVGTYAWVQHDECAFDWAVLDKVKPDVVLIAFSEREARCRGGRPRHMPAASK